MTNPYLSIWFRTSRTINSVLLGKVRFNYHIPILLSCLSLFFDQFTDPIGIGTVYSLLLIFIGIILGYLFITQLWPWLILQVGKIWNGKSEKPELLLIIGLGQIPVVVILMEQILFSAFGKVISDFEVNIALQWIVWVFYMRTMVIGLSKIQGFGYGIALLNLVLAIMPFFILKLLIS
ncbi:MAG: hypothetical protein AAF149_05675 [Bacteroidota bacterium]